jgi:hypothetical protein
MKPRKYPERKVKVRHYKPRFIMATRKQVNADYMKYLRVVRAWARFKHGISLDDFEMLCFLYSEHIFDADQYDHYRQIFGFSQARRVDFINRGLIVYFRKPGTGQRAIYELSAQAKSIMRQCYAMLAGEKPIPSIKEVTPKSDKPHHFATRQYDRVINKINKNSKEPPLHLSQR